MKMTSQKLLREYVRACLLEDDGGGGDYGGMIGAGMAMSPYGIHFASSNALYGAFIKPFVDVVDVAVGKTKEMSVKAQTLLKATFEAVATSVLPWLSSDYAEIFADEQEKLNKIRTQYGEVYKATWDAFKNKDVALSAFFCYPGAVLTGELARQAPNVALAVLSTISGGTLDPWIKRVKAAYGSEASSGHSSSPKKEKYSSSYSSKETHAGSFYSPAGDKAPTWESVIREDGGKKRPDLADIVTKVDVVKAALNSPVALQLQKDARAMERATLEAVLSRATAITSAKSLEDLQHKVGKPLKGLEKLHTMDQTERAAAEGQLLMDLRKSMKEFYAKSLEAQAKDAVSAGIPKNSKFVTDYVEVARKIRAL